MYAFNNIIAIANYVQKDFGLQRKMMLNVGTREKPYLGGELSIPEREL
jgi:hypothetical protein